MLFGRQRFPLRPQRPQRDRDLPAGLGRVAIAVYIKKSASTQRERTIAQIARCVYDYMLVAAAGNSVGAPPQR